jgi:hypothetical protein
MTLTDAELTDLFGPKCPDCGWRRGQHRPDGQWLTRCPRYAPTDTTEEEA